MPDWRELAVGDRVRLLKVPEAALRERAADLVEGVAEPGYTADTIEKIIAQEPVVTISRVDDDEVPWFDYLLLVEDGIVEEHWLAITDDDWWEYADCVGIDSGAR